jgi:hypothetical protein
VQVYGLSVSGIGTIGGVTAPPPADAPRLHVTRAVGRAADPAFVSYTDDRVVLALIDEGQLVVERRPATATYLIPHAISDDELLHPWLVPAIAVTAGWHGRRVLHGGLVGTSGRAVALVADKEGGKSTLLSWLAVQGEVDIYSDDLVVLDEDTAFAGPRCIDLRQPTVDNMTLDGRVRLVRDGTRWRLTLPAAPPTVTLAGVIVLEWGDTPSLEPVRPSQRLAALLPHSIGYGLPPGADGILGFVRYPVWRLVRPKNWDALPASAALIRRVLDGA